MPLARASAAPVGVPEAKVTCVTKRRVIFVNNR